MSKITKILLSILIGLIVLVLAGYMYLTKAQKTDEDISWLSSSPIAHRGLHNEKYIENSMGAFKNAIDYNYPIELDVRFTKDKQVVVFHDDSLERVTNDNRNVDEVDYEELKSIKLEVDGVNPDTEEYIPLLKDVLETVDSKVPILIEIKDCSEVIELSHAVYDLVKDYKGQFAIQSFNPFSVQWYKNNAPEVVRGQLSGSMADSDLKFYEKFALENLLLNFMTKPNFIAYEYELLPKFRTKQSGIPLIGWTIRSEEEAKKAYENCDNIIMENFLVK
jgi:glycerophosphoryl diester phosphodiesterase